MEEEVIYDNPFVGDELEIMCHRAILNLRKARLEKDIRDYSQLFKYATPEMEAFEKLVNIVEGLVKDLSEVNEKLTQAI
jgi:hypothetical protein